MSIRFRLLTEADVRAVLTMEDLIETMTSALRRFSTGRVVQPVLGQQLIGLEGKAEPVGRLHHVASGAVSLSAVDSGVRTGCTSAIAAAWTWGDSAPEFHNNPAPA